MRNPLSQVGQTPHPEESQQQQGEQRQSQQPGSSAPAVPEANPSGERPATRLPQHPQQQQEETAALDERARQQTETDNEDAELRHDSAV